MTLAIIEAVIYGYRPSNDSLSRADADYIIPGGDINSIEISQRGEELKDSGTLDIDNYAGRYTNDVDHGDRLEVYLARPATGEASARYGETQYGSAQYAGDALEHRWTGRVRKISNSANGADNYSLSVEAEDYVYGILGSRRLWASYVGRKLHGSTDAILNDALQQKAPEIGRDRIETDSGTTDLKWNGRTLLDLLKEILARGGVTAASDGMDLIVKDCQAAVPEFTIGKGTDDWRLPSYTSNDDELINSLRVAGGTSPELDDSVDKAGETEVTNSSRITAQISTRVSSLHSIEIWTKDVSDDSVLVRLQKDDGGSPVAIGDKKSDIVNEQMQHDELTDGGWTSFELPNHTLPEPNPWLIVESTDVDGQTVGTDGAGNPAYRAFFPFPVSVQQQDPGSIAEYGRRDGRVTDESLNTATAAYDHADAVLADQATPSESISFVATSRRTHDLGVADLLQIEDEYLGVSGEFVVTQKDEKISGGTVETSITAQSLASI